jgi:alpha-glucoside transport system permease protein
MWSLTLRTIITVAAGIGAAIVVFWLLDRACELLPYRFRDKVKPLVYILPAYVAITVYLIYPAILTVIYSFKDAASQNWVGWKNYTSLLGSSDFRGTIFNTVLWIAIVPILSVVVGLAVAVLTDKLKPGAEKFSKTIIFLPMAISMVGSATIWRFMYSYDAQRTALGKPQIGLQNAAWQLVGGSPTYWLGQQQFHINSGWLMLMLLWGQIGFAMVLLSAAVKGVPEDTLEAARIDGAGERAVFFRIVVPQIKGTVITVFITVTIMVLKVFDIVYVMTNGKMGTNVLGNEFFQQMLAYYDKGKASTIVVIMMIAVIPIMYYQVKHFRAEEAA